MVITVDGRDAAAPYEHELTRQREAAAKRVVERTSERRDHEATLARPGGLRVADTPERIAKRVERLRRYYGDAVEREPTLERIINTADFVGIRYLDAGVAAARAIGRVNIRGAGGRLQGYGTGSLVSPAPLLTNHHVLPDAETARYSAIEFNYQDGLDGLPLPAQVFPFDPDKFFLADEERDCALVAVRAAPGELAPFGFNRLIEAEGKAIIGEYVTIVQHPRGEKKQVALSGRTRSSTSRSASCITRPTPSRARPARSRSTTSGSRSRCTTRACRRPSTASSTASSTRASGSAGSSSSSRRRRWRPRGARSPTRSSRPAARLLRSCRMHRLRRPRRSRRWRSRAAS